MTQISYAREKFPSLFGPDGQKWNDLFDAHGMEVRGRKFKLFWSRYYEIERQSRLIWIVARNHETGEPVGYSCHWWYVDMHFSDVIGADDLWYVIPAMRKLGIGRNVKLIGLHCLKKAGAVRTYDLIRDDGPWRTLKALGYEVWGTRWVSDLQQVESLGGLPRAYNEAAE